MHMSFKYCFSELVEYKLNYRCIVIMENFMKLKKVCSNPININVDISKPK